MMKSLGQIAYEAAMHSRFPDFPKERWEDEWNNWEGDYMSKEDWEHCAKAVAKEQTEIINRNNLAYPGLA